jgi:ribosomal protein L40E
MIQFQCGHCGKRMQTEDHHGGKNVKCTGCSAIATVPMPQAIAPAPALSAPIPIVPQSQDISCPSCRTTLPPAAVLCVRCGYNLQTGQRLSTRIKLKRIDKRLEPSPSLLARLIIWGALAMLPFPLVLVMQDASAVIGFMVGWLVWAGAWCLGLGTFVRSWLHRDDNKEVVLSKSQWIGFLPVINKELYLADYNFLFFDYRLGASDQMKALFLVIVLFLLCFLVVPGLIFWYAIFRQEAYLLELGTDKFSKTEVIYVGGNQQIMHQFAEEIQEVADHLKIDRK